MPMLTRLYGRRVVLDSTVNALQTFQREEMENLIKAHKPHLASDRTSCSKATANQFRLLIHTAAYSLLHTLRGLAPKASFWREAQFDTLRLGLIKVAARVTEMKTRINVSLPTSSPSRKASRCWPPELSSCRRERRGDVPPNGPVPATLQPRHAAPLTPPIQAPSGSRSKTLMNDAG